MLNQDLFNYVDCLNAISGLKGISNKMFISIKRSSRAVEPQYNALKTGLNDFEAIIQPVCEKLTEGTEDKSVTFQRLIEERTAFLEGNSCMIDEKDSQDILDYFTARGEVLSQDANVDDATRIWLSDEEFESLPEGDYVPAVIYQVLHIDNKPADKVEVVVAKAKKGKTK